ncbi:MAG: hypothetical protein IPK13_13650 [Deltaproteobacteria bacterium]|nr:hypothetical protein [Deltaproteobacteria bacterium]
MQLDIVGNGGGIPVGNPVDARTARILARSIFKDMQAYGVSDDRILEIAGELIGLVTAKIEDQRRAT